MADGQRRGELDRDVDADALGSVTLKSRAVDDSGRIETPGPGRS